MVPYYADVTFVTTCGRTRHEIALRATNLEAVSFQAGTPPCGLEARVLVAIYQWRKEAWG